MRIRILPYKARSKSAKLLANALGGKRIKLKNSSFHGRSTDVVINWGNSRDYPFTMDRVTGLPAPLLLNMPDDVARVVNKLLFFQEFHGCGHLPDYWIDVEEIPDKAFPIVCRTALTGHSGSGIVIAHCRDDLVPAPLYVKYIKKQEEYRVHLMYEKPFLIQQKKRRLDHDNPNWQIRNHSNGFIYARNEIDPPAGVVDAASDCFAATGLDFGAVDVIWNEHQQRAYVLEINTAPGLEGSTLDDYVNAFKEAIEENS